MGNLNCVCELLQWRHYRQIDIDDKATHRSRYAFHRIFTLLSGTEEENWVTGTDLNQTER